MKKQLILLVLLTVGLVQLCFAQSTDVEHPTPITTNEISGSTTGSGIYYFVIDALRNETFQVDLRLTFSKGIGFSLDFRDMDAGTLGRDGDTTYFPVDSGGKGTVTRTGTFTTTRRQRILLMLNFSGTGSYRVSFARAGGDDDTLIARPPGIEVPVGSLCVDLAVQSLNFNPTRNDRGRITSFEVSGGVKNITTLDYVSTKPMQSIQLWERSLGDTFLLVKTFPLVNLAANSSVPISYTRNVSDFDRRNPPTFRLVIKFADNIRDDGNRNNDDCNSKNNSLTQTFTIR